MSKIFVATVQLTIESDSLFEAQDAVENILSEYSMADGTLTDWEYLKLGVHHLSPTRNHDLEVKRARQQTWRVAAG